MSEKRSAEPAERLLADEAPVRRRTLRRVVALAILVWIAFLWLHQVLDTPGAPIEVGAIDGLPPAAEEIAEIAAAFDAYTGERTELRGAVRTADGATAADVMVALTSGDEFFWTRTDALGTFALAGLPTGRAWLAAVPMAAPGIDLDIELPLAEPLVLELPPPFAPLAVLPEIRRAPLEGRVELPHERAATGCEIVLLPLEITSTGSRPLAAPGLDGRVERRAIVDLNGWFKFEELALGAYQVRVLPAFARGASWPVIGTQAFTHADDGQVPIVRATCGAIEGVVLGGDGKPVAGALVQVASASDATLMLPVCTTDALGAFAIEDVPEGSLRIRARAGALMAERTLRLAPLRREPVELRLR